jgi:diaminohydroxyphosphoribosylaminopyrimidine deaminase / 5-amino-6-(5-phosphoribosylamino)uracil reductase
VTIPEPDETATRQGPPAELTERDRYWLRRAVSLARHCPPAEGAFSVGAVIVDAGGREIAAGWSRQHDPHDHAEEAALASLAPGDERLADATIYSSLEPCGERRSRPRTCVELILDAGIRRVVYAMAEPDLFVEPCGDRRLRSAGVTVVTDPDLAPEVQSVNAHLDPMTPRSPDAGTDR